MYYYFIIVCLFSIPSWAIFDEILEKSREAAQVGFIADAGADLFDELDPTGASSEDLKSFRDAQSNLSRQASQTLYLGEDIKDFINGPDYTTKGIERGLRATTSFVKRGRRLLLSLAALGPKGASEIAQLQSSTTLNDMHANQVNMMAEDRRRRIAEAKEKVKEENDWREFIEKTEELKWSQ